VQAEPDENFLRRKDFCKGIALLNQHSYTYDILIYPNQLPAAIEFVRKFPDQRFVIDHLAKPPIKAKRMEPWKTNMIEMARFENVYCKLSGMVTEADWKNWNEADLCPYMDIIFNAFDIDHIMYGSDWPVCLLATTYEMQYQIIVNYISKLSSSEKLKVLGGNAVKFYHL
jgi:L-fuconolactonase